MIFIVYEINSHGDYASMGIKLLNVKFDIARRFFTKHKRLYGKNSSDWNLILAKYKDNEPSIENDVRRDFQTILTTEK